MIKPSLTYKISLLMCWIPKGKKPTDTWDWKILSESWFSKKRILELKNMVDNTVKRNALLLKKYVTTN